MSDTYPTVRLAAAQVAPVFLDREATIAKACDIIREAGANGADLVAFPEGYVPAHPLWFHFHPATSPTSSAMSIELVNNAVVVPSPETDALCAAARAASCMVVIGICEKTASSMGTLYNSQLVIGRDGAILGCRRKIVPTVGERIVHTPGAGDSVRVFPTEFGSVSGLMCGENSNPLLTYSMQALGARVHVASWPSFFNRSVDMQAIADVAGRSIAYQNSCFVVNTIGAVSPEMEERLPASDEDRAHIREAAGRGGSAIYAPGGRVLAGPLGGGEDILYAEADIGRIVPRKIVHDYAGDYNRFDIFQLAVNVTPAAPSIRVGAARQEPDANPTWLLIDGGPLRQLSGEMAPALEPGSAPTGDGERSSSPSPEAPSGRGE
ncbi:MAG TPA: carbon-nitrogen hydrolase family protein [Candidatus Limnocylindrales bacterium]|nr:carbon-nitrogen hydrolase family protein [Candidatus Limnocylindrales bacterium]